MKEKVLYFTLPNDAKYRRVIVTEDGKIGIVYSEECTCHMKHNAMSTVNIPKPRILVGGSEVYKENDVPYWYCNIKNGRDKFMHIYMEDLTEHDLLFDSKTGKERVFSDENQKKFKSDVLEALANKPKEGFRWIPAYEPSCAPNGKIQFVENEKPWVGQFNCSTWKQKFEAYSPENESSMSSKTTYFLLLLRWLKDDIATLEQLVSHSEQIGNYHNTVNSKHVLEKTGRRMFGGVYGFVGNTCKIVEGQNSKSGYVLLGGCYFNNGSIHPLSDVAVIYSSYNGDGNSVGLMELKK